MSVVSAPNNILSKELYTDFAIIDGVMYYISKILSHTLYPHMIFDEYVRKFTYYNNKLYVLLLNPHTNNFSIAVCHKDETIVKILPLPYNFNDTDYYIHSYLSSMNGFIISNKIDFHSVVITFSDDDEILYSSPIAGLEPLLYAFTRSIFAVHNKSVYINSGGMLLKSTITIGDCYSQKPPDIEFINAAIDYNKYIALYNIAWQDTI